MWKILICTFFFITINCFQSSAEIINCRYFPYSLSYLPEPIYFCQILNSEIFNGTQISITEIQGLHWFNNTNENVTGIYLHSAPNLNKFPKNLEKFFKNLILIRILGSNLTEISQNDFKVFPKLKYLYLFENKIKIIHEDTFAFNPELKVIDLDGNEISHIDPKSFSNLKNLIELKLIFNVCKIDKRAEIRKEVEELIIKIENGECRN
ncbi:hypothetical protein PVAND_016936 [Polypedilum vanderplanki]|uniref:Uncharacterized protein n=1 Tax=Polypedilum vanderplanki TaxID=319348 RepID=A0A9J6BH50_POLVA|nr:hypothetical protein PVAND_016936 [Polypedilum vanderplanki]